MTLTQDLRTHNGTLLVPRGFEVTPAFLERIRNYGADFLAERVKVLVATAGAGAAAGLAADPATSAMAGAATGAAASVARLQVPRSVQ